MATVEEMLSFARSRLRRLEPARAWAALQQGATLVDIRSDGQRAADGVVPGSVHIPRNVLEWRLDPASPYRDACLARPGDRVMLICDEGCQSSLAAATVQQLGIVQATDVIGGFRAWRREGLPVEVLEA